MAARHAAQRSMMPVNGPHHREDTGRAFRGRMTVFELLLIIIFYVRNDHWDYETFIKSACKSEVYVKPLTLEDGKAGTFLATSFRIKNNKVEH